MAITSEQKTKSVASDATPRVPPWEALIEPGRIFAHSDDVLTEPGLSHAEKRIILASWASDACAVESAPALRHCPGLPGSWVTLDAVLAALRALDPASGAQAAAARSPATVSWGPFASIATVPDGAKRVEVKMAAFDPYRRCDPD